MNIAVMHVGADGDEYTHSYREADFSAVFKPGFITVIGAPTNGYAAGGPARTVHYETGRVIRISQDDVVVFPEPEVAEAVQS
jgi:hypothetical protein